MKSHPAYLNLGTAELKRRAEKLCSLISPCRLCPNLCEAKRAEGKKGTCGVASKALVSSYNLHFGEEPCLVGEGGSGTIFFAGCSLRCLFCQNYPISQFRYGNEVSKEDLAKMMLELQRDGAENINFVTPTHVTAQIIDALVVAVEAGLKLPIVWNSGGYELVEVLELLDGIVDIYLPDMKYSDDKLALECSQAKDYVEINRMAIMEMWRQVGPLKLDERGVARRGLLIRHLVLPNNLENSRGVLKWISSVDGNIAISAMAQFFPAFKAPEHPYLNRRLTKAEWAQVEAWIEEFGIKEGYFQRM